MAVHSVSICPDTEKTPNNKGQTVPTCTGILWAKSNINTRKSKSDSHKTFLTTSEHQRSHRGLLPRTKGTCDTGICFISIFAHNSFLQTTAKHSSEGFKDLTSYSSQQKSISQAGTAGHRLAALANKGKVHNKPEKVNHTFTNDRLTTRATSYT